MLGAGLLMVAVGGIVGSNGRAKAVPQPGAARSTAVKADAAVVLRQNRDRVAAGDACSAAVRHLLGRPPRNSQDVNNEIVVRSAGDGVLSIEVRVPLDGAQHAVYRCQATNQTGAWDAESVAKVER